MKDKGWPIVFTWFKPADCRFPLGKILVSSACRSLFSGTIEVYNPERTAPLFRIGRKGVSETHSPQLRESNLLRSELATAIRVVGAANTDPSHDELQWIVFAHAAGICLRNIDHLFPMVNSDGGGSQRIDMLWTKPSSGDNQIESYLSSFGLIAIRRKYLSLAMDHLVEAENRFDESNDKELTLINLLRSLPLQKRFFENREVYAPRIGAVDWGALNNAAFVTVPNWPEKEQWSFLQALYFGTYFGDDTGLILNILDP